MHLRIKEVAESKGIGAGALSDRTGIGLSTIKKLWVDPSVDVPNTDTATLEKIAKALEVPAKELIA